MTHAFILSRLYYCNSLYFGISQTALSRLQLVQNAVAWLLSEAKKREHITPILNSLVHFRVDFKILLFVYKSLNGLAPAYLVSYWRSIDPLDPFGFPTRIYCLPLSQVLSARVIAVFVLLPQGFGMPWHYKTSWFS